MQPGFFRLNKYFLGERIPFLEKIQNKMEDIFPEQNSVMFSQKKIRSLLIPRLRLTPTAKEMI